jgi:hypothetical protein
MLSFAAADAFAAGEDAGKDLDDLEALTTAAAAAAVATAAGSGGGGGDDDAGDTVSPAGA